VSGGHALRRTAIGLALPLPPVASGLLGVSTVSAASVALVALDARVRFAFVGLAAAFRLVTVRFATRAVDRFGAAGASQANALDFGTRPSNKPSR